MFSLESVFPCLRYHKSRRLEQLDVETDKQADAIIKKKSALRASAVELEATVREFLDDRKDFQAGRNER